MPRKMIISCGGLGMGNASRVFAIAQAIRKLDPGMEVHFFSWGRGYEFLTKAAAGIEGFFVKELRAYPWLRARRSLLPRWLNNLCSYAAVYAVNTRLLSEAQKEIQPDAVVLDSDYHFAAFSRRKTRLFFLGQALDVITRAKKLGYRPGSITAHLSFFFCEVADSLIQRALTDRVFVPSFLEQEAPVSGARAVRVPLIVREEFREAVSKEAQRKAVVVTSGSGIELTRLSEIAASVGGVLTSQERDLALTSPSTFQDAEVVVIQGGLSSISECIALQKPMLVVPILGRAEQEVNARTVEQLGLGFSLENENWKNLLGLGVGSATARLTPVKVLVHGADVIARHIFAYA